MLKQIIINNVIAVIIHTVFCCFSYFLLSFIMRYEGSLFTSVLFVIVAIAIPILYVLCGRLFLRNTNNITNNVLSVTIVAIVLIVLMFMSMNDGHLMIANYSFVPIAVYTIRFLPTFIAVLIFALLPSITLYIGMITKKLGG